VAIDQRRRVEQSKKIEPQSFMSVTSEISAREEIIKTAEIKLKRFRWMQLLITLGAVKILKILYSIPLNESLDTSTNLGLLYNILRPFVQTLNFSRIIGKSHLIMVVSGLVNPAEAARLRKHVDLWEKYA
jgi:hypothetical protein